VRFSVNNNSNATGLSSFSRGEPAEWRSRRRGGGSGGTSASGVAQERGWGSAVRGAPKRWPVARAAKERERERASQAGEAAAH